MVGMFGNIDGEFVGGASWGFASQPSPEDQLLGMMVDPLNKLKASVTKENGFMGTDPARGGRK